jgi:tetratricopeptide (TPR) repeat protein
MSATDDTERPESEGADEGEQGVGILGRWIAISLAAIAVVGAGIGVLQTDAAVNESNTARETTRTAVGSLRAGVAETGGRLLEQDIDAERGALYREQDFLARQSGEAAEPLSDAELTSIIPKGGELPGARTEKELRRLSFDSELLALRQAALAETRVTWNDRSTQYTTAIAILAFALFLVGFSLVLRGRRRLVFYVFGIVIAVLTVGAAAYIFLLPIPETPDEAVEATARGTVVSEDGNQARAIESFDEAVEIDGDFAAPYSRRAVARALAANPDLQATGAVTGSEDSFDESIADTRRALELGGNRDFLALAFATIATLYAGEYERSVEAGTRAIEINSQIPDIRLAKSAAEVGLGDTEAALSSLDEAAELLSGSDASERTRGLVANYLTYLEQVVYQVPERAQLVRRIEQRIIGNETSFNLDRDVSGKVPDSGSVEITGLRYANGKFQLRTSWNDLPPGTALTLIGFERPARDSGWVQPRGLALFRTVGGSGGEAGQAPVKHQCKPVEVRVDTYLDGAFVDSATGPGGPATC